MKKNALLGVMILLGVWCLFYVGVKIDMWRLGYDMEELESRRTVLKKQQEVLRVRFSELTDPQQVARRAQDELRLMLPQDGQVVMISRDIELPSESGEQSPARLVQNFSTSLFGRP